jgi:hypothetical protein
MTFISNADRAKALLLAAALSSAFISVAPPARAQFPQMEQDQVVEASASLQAAVAPPLTDEEISQLDWSQLDADAWPPRDGLAAKALTAKAASGDGSTTWTNNNQANGASAVSVKEKVSPFWDTRVGADMTVTREPATMSELLAEKSANGGNLPQSGGSAWAAVTAPGAGPVWDKTAVEARVNPDTDQSKLGTSISKQVPLNDQTSLTLSNGYNMTQQGMVPVPGMVSRPERTYDTDQSAKVELTETGTSLTAGQTLSTSDDKWLRKVGAEQKLFGGVTISGSIGETAQGTTNKSVTAGFKKSW